MPFANLKDLFVHGLQNAFSSERQLGIALPRFAKAAGTPELKQAFAEQGEKSAEHVRRLQTVFESLDHQPEGVTCRGIESLIREADDILKRRTGPSDVVDARLVSVMQRIQHYEMALYGSLGAFAKSLGRRADANLLLRTRSDAADAAAEFERIASVFVDEDVLV